MPVIATDPWGTGVNPAGSVGETGTVFVGSTATVWLLQGDTLSTPPAPPAVAGVAREAVFDMASDHGLEAVERQLTIADYESADEVFLSNAVGGLVRARRYPAERRRV